MSKPRSQSAVIALLLLAVAEVLVMTLWFSATAVLPELSRRWSLGPSGAAWLTASVQLGFVLGALGSAFFNLVDRIPTRRLFAISALLAAGATLLVEEWAPSFVFALILRLLTGVFLAGVYPPGMKIAAGHVRGSSRGLAIGTLVGALTLGSATPHLLAATGGVISASFVLRTASLLAVIGAVMVLLLVTDGPYTPKSAPFDPRQMPAILKRRSVLLANLGYFGHMWELYAVWAWLVVFLDQTTVLDEPRYAAFTFIGLAGVVGAIAGGALADRVGRTKLTFWAMFVSGTCCIVSPAVAAAPVAMIWGFGLVWGASVIADSAQFSAAVTELADPEYMGTALTLQTSLGFALTLVPIWSLPYIADVVGWRFAFVALAPGPFLGCWAMYVLRKDPDAIHLAGGKY